MEEYAPLIGVESASKQRVLAIPYFNDSILFYPLPVRGFHHPPAFPKLERYSRAHPSLKFSLKLRFDTEDPAIKFLKRIEDVEELEIIYPTNFTQKK